MLQYIALYLYFDRTLLHMILHAIALFFLDSSLLFLLHSSSDLRYFLRLYPFFPFPLRLRILSLYTADSPRFFNFEIY